MRDPSKTNQAQSTVLRARTGAMRGLPEETDGDLETVRD